MIIAFGGYKNSGKSEATKYLIEKYGFSEVKMADPLKDMIRTLYSYSNYTKEEIEDRVEGSLKDEFDEFLNCTPRQAMQQLGTEWRDSLPNTTLWSDIFLDRVRKTKDNIVSSDVRFVHEIEALRDVGGYYVWIRRPGKKSDGHASEKDMSSYANFIIENDHDINKLCSEVERVHKIFLTYSYQGI